MNLIQKRVEKEYKEKKDFSLKDKRYYQKKLKEFGLKPLMQFMKYFPEPSENMKKGITYAHKDIEKIAEAIANKKPWAAVSGLNPSGPLHFGHKIVFEELLWMQKHGADIFIPLTNDESYIVGKSGSLAEARKIAYNQVIPSIIAMGFKPKKTHIFVDSDYPEIYNIAMDLSTKTTLNKSFKIFGFDQTEKGENPGTMFYRSAVQIAQILLPQYPEFGGPKPTLVPVGIDQYPYILLSRDVAEKKGFIPPASIFLKFLFGLDGKGKMSASKEDSSLFLTDSEERVRKIIKTAYTGGNPFADFQRKHGGIPEICPIYTLRINHINFKEKVKEECLSGEVLCGECKKRATKEVLQYLSKHQAKLPEAKKELYKYLLRTPIKSILDGK